MCIKTKCFECGFNEGLQTLSIEYEESIEFICSSCGSSFELPLEEEE
jgi:hypothetical protein